MTYTRFDVDVADNIAHVRLNRPEQHNAMDRAFWRELPQCVREIAASGEVRVIVLSSIGKHFCAGMDTTVFSGSDLFDLGKDPGRMAENLRRIVLQTMATINALEEVRIPVLAAIQGGCIGGALDMVCACDSRYATEDAFFTVKETQIGMTADLGTLQRLPKLIPEGMARELAYTGRKFSAQEAKALGFVNAVYADQEAMLAAVLDLARQIAQNSPLAVTGCKEMINFSRDHSLADSLKYMACWQSGMFRPKDLAIAFTAQAKKQAPEFEDLWPEKEWFGE